MRRQRAHRRWNGGMSGLYHTAPSAVKSSRVDEACEQAHLLGKREWAVQPFSHHLRTKCELKR